MVRRGQLIGVGRRGYRLAGFPTTRHQAVLLACAEIGGVASHATAAELHGLVDRSPNGRIHVLAARRANSRHGSDLAVVHTTTRLPIDDVTTIDTIPCTSVARTLLLLAGEPGADAERLRDLVDAAIRDGKASDAWMWWRLERLRCRGRSGVTLLAAILSVRADGEVTESWLERRFLAVVTAAGLPTPRCQQRIDHLGVFVGRVDFLYEAEHLVIEVNGHAFHSTPDQLGRDAARRARLQLAGYRVLEFTYDQLVRGPDAVVATIREALTQGAAA